MRHINEYRLKQNNKITQFFYPDREYTYNCYPSIVPYCALPNFNSILEYEIEDMIDKKYKIELYKLFLKKDGIYSDNVIKMRKENFISYDKLKRAEKVIKEREDNQRLYNQHIERCRVRNREFVFEYKPILYEDSDKSNKSERSIESVSVGVDSKEKAYEKEGVEINKEIKLVSSDKAYDSSLNKVNKKGFEKNIISKGGVRLNLPVLK